MDLTALWRIWALYLIADRVTRRKGVCERDRGTEDDGSLPAGFAITRWPVHSNRISLAFGESARKYGDPNKLHKALDFLMKEGSAVHSVAAGHVEKSRYSENYGNYIVIDHGNGYKTKYANNKLNKVEQGDYVGAHQEIAVVGNTSKDSTGPHLHFEVRHGDSRIDPKSVFAPGH